MIAGGSALVGAQIGQRVNKEPAVSRPVKNSIVGVILDTLGWSLLWGLGLCAGFYALIHFNVIDSPFVRRYFAGHPVEYIETAMFFVGVVAILGKASGVLGQFGTMSRVEFASRPTERQEIAAAADMLAPLKELPARVRQCYFVCRLQSALNYVIQKESVADLEEELKHLSDQDAARQYSDFGLVRIIIWATPMLGFLGTVIGITLALGNLSPIALVETPEKAMEGLLASLSIAFDTTALALSLSVALMFFQFAANQLEIELLTAVDQRVAAELIGRFHDPVLDYETSSGAVPAAHPPAAGTADVPALIDALDMGRLAEAVTASMDRVAEQNANSLKEAIATAQEKWQYVVDAAVEHMRTNVDDTLRASAIDHVNNLSRAEESSAERVHRRWNQVEEVLTENARVMRDQQAELARQGDILLKTIEGSADITRLQRALNNNLDALNQTQHLEDTLTNLTGAVNLFTSRLADAAERPRLRLYDVDGDDRDSLGADDTERAA
jgi:biopolymer transport protein ExbB/TolQ